MLDHLANNGASGVLPGWAIDCPSGGVELNSGRLARAIRSDNVEPVSSLVEGDTRVCPHEFPVAASVDADAGQDRPLRTERPGLPVPQAFS